eukprot:8417243-Heterocapsa_arctica.AAC.1
MAKDYTAKATKDVDFGKITELTEEQAEFHTKAYADPIWDMPVLVKHDELGDGICIPGEDHGCISGNMAKLCRGKDCYTRMAMKNT